MSWRARLALLLLVVQCGPATAQVRVVRHGDDRLVGIAEVDVLVSTETADRSCPVDIADARQLAVSVLRDGGVRASASQKARSWHYSVVVDIQTSAMAGPCASSVSSELVAEVAGVPEADKALAPGTWGSLLVGPMSLARETTLVISARVAHHASVRQAVAAQVAAIAARIRSANH